jgi:hypothetical protein
MWVVVLMGIVFALNYFHSNSPREPASATATPR